MTRRTTLLHELEVIESSDCLGPAQCCSKALSLVSVCRITVKKIPYGPTAALPEAASESSINIRLQLRIGRGQTRVFRGCCNVLNWTFLLQRKSYVIKSNS